MHGSPSPSDVWAKLTHENNDRSSSVIAWNTLWAHSADVAAVTEALLSRTLLGPRLARLAGWEQLSPVHIARLSAFAALHDAGKVNHGFQNRAFGHTPEADHVTPVLNLLETDDVASWLEAMGVMEIVHQGWMADLDVLEQMLLATWSHHGTPVQPASPNLRLWTPTDTRDPAANLKQLATYIRQWFPEAFDGTAPAFPDAPRFQHAYNGLLTLADWIGSDNERFFPFVTDRSDPMPDSRKHAATAIEKLFLEGDALRIQLPESVGFDRVLEEPTWTPHPVQQACYDLPIHDSGSLTILESDTGSGKTEAALARYVRLFQAGQVDAMYFAVPTRSAATQLHGRVEATIKRIFGDAERRPPVVQAVPGYIKADDREAMRLPGFEVRWDDEDETMQYRGWAAESPKRYLAGPIVVGTVDQVLLSALQVPHAHMRGAALLRHFLVVDEVHASDVYMTALMDRVLDQHLHAGGHALMMSATLGSAARTHLTTANRTDPPAPKTAETEDYPLLTHVAADRRDPTSVHAASVSSAKTVQPTLHPIANAPETLAERAAQYADQGARVLIIRNLVDDCVATQRAVEAVAPARHLFGCEGTAAPHHSRFAPDDRSRLDDAIESTFGKTADRTGGGIAVATQTVEQSLDIDADILLTDLCPIDVLLQRIGRLHRHTRARPDGFDTARCEVLVPPERDLGAAITGEGKGIQGDHGLGTVYQDLRMLEAAWQVLDDEALPSWRIPDHNRLLVERATHPDRLHRIVEEAEGDAWARHERWVMGEEMANEQHARYNTIDFATRYSENGFPSDNERIMTRLGEPDYRIQLPEPLPGPFGAAISEVSLPQWRFDDPPETDEASSATAFDGGFRFTIAGQTFRYDRFGIADA